MGAAGKSISSYAANLDLPHTTPLAAALVGEGELSFERFVSVEAEVAATEVVAIAAEGTRLLAVAAAARVNIDDVDPSFVELKLVFARFDMEGGPDRYGLVLMLAAHQSDVPHYSDPLPCSTFLFVQSGPVFGRRPEQQ